MKEIVDKLILKKKTIGVMESCTGGYITNAITNVEGASEIIQFGAVTYSNEFKVKMGVSKETIQKYTVYSQEVANEMSYVISQFTGANYGIGVTGKLKREDINNLYGEDDLVYISIYDKENTRYYNEIIKCSEKNRVSNKELVLKKIIEILKIVI